MYHRLCSTRNFNWKYIKKISSRSHHLLCKIFTKWSFFLFVYFISYKKISPSRQIIISYWGSINFTGLSDESRRINKKGQSNGRDFLVRVTTDDLCSDPKCDKSIMEWVNGQWLERQGNVQWKYPYVCSDASDRTCLVLSWRYERWSNPF